MSNNNILTKREILKEIENRNIIVEPLLDKKSQIESTHIDLRLDSNFVKFVTFEESCIDMAEKTKNFVYVKKEYFHETFIIHPGEFVLGLTFEYISLPNDILGRLDGKSSLGRRGIVVHATAGGIDPGWRGHLVFELANLGEIPVKLYPLTKIARITFFRVKEVDPYKGAFRGQTKILIPDYDKVARQLKQFKEKDNKC